jgi:DNA (cytosine-5)-methyltransferase 1
MSWLYSQALVEEYLVGISLDGEQSVQSSGNHTQQAYCAPDKMTAFSRLSRYGMTYKPLTQTHGEALLMSYLEVFHAKTLVPLEKESASMESGQECGEKMARIIREVRPRFVFVENSPMLTSRGLGRVLGDLASMGFDARWGVLGAANVGAPHQRDRIWIVAKWRGQLPHAQHDRIRWWEQQQKSFTQEDGKVADSTSYRSQEQANERILESQRRSEFQFGEPRDTREVAYAQCEGLEGQSRNESIQECGSSVNSSGSLSADELAYTEDKGDVWRDWQLGFTQQEHDSGRGSTDGSRQWWSVEPAVGRVAHGVANRVDRLKAIGNGQVPLCAATAWRVLNAGWG